MDVREIRRRNLEFLATKVARDVIAQKCGWPNVTYVNQLIKGHANIGPRTAKKIVTAFPDFGTGGFWIDTPQWDERGPAALAAAASHFTPEEMDVLWATLEMIKSRRESSPKE